MSPAFCQPHPKCALPLITRLFSPPNCRHPITSPALVPDKVPRLSARRPFLQLQPASTARLKTHRPSILPRASGFLQTALSKVPGCQTWGRGSRPFWPGTSDKALALYVKLTSTRPAGIPRRWPTSRHLSPSPHAPRLQGHLSYLRTPRHKDPPEARRLS